MAKERTNDSAGSGGVGRSEGTMITSKAGHPEAAAAIWHWKESAPQPMPHASAARNRMMGSLQACLGAGVGLLSYVFWSPKLAFFIFGVAGIILMAALVSPTALYAGIQRMFEALGQALGRGLTFVLMSGLFYAFFFPFGKLLRRGRRDRMKRWFEADAVTYWEARRQTDPGSLERQY
jgi:hypothetical protein